MKKKLLISSIIIIAIILIMNIGLQFGNIRIGKQNDTLGIKEKSEIKNSKFYTRHLENDILLNLWASWCKPCIEEMPLLNDVKKKYSKKNIKFLSFSVDKDTVKLSKFNNSNKFNYKDITLQNLQYRTAILNYLQNKPIENKINSYSIPKTYILKNKKVIKIFKGGFKNTDKLISEIDKVLENEE